MLDSIDTFQPSVILAWMDTGGALVWALQSDKDASFVHAAGACLESRVMGCHRIHQTPCQRHSHVYQLHIHIYLSCQ